MNSAKPQYKPEQWVVFSLGEGFGFGQILGGVQYSKDSSWNYFVTGSQGEHPYSVSEDEVSFYWEANQWNKADGNS